MTRPQPYSVQTISSSTVSILAFQKVKEKQLKMVQPDASGFRTSDYTNLKTTHSFLLVHRVTRRQPETMCLTKLSCWLTKFDTKYASGLMQRRHLESKMSHRELFHRCCFSRNDFCISVKTDLSSCDQIHMPYPARPVKTSQLFNSVPQLASVGLVWDQCYPVGL